MKIRYGILCLTFVVLLLFSTATLATNKTCNPKAISLGNILYVGGSGPDNYTRIQDAIDNASDGDTVFVFSKLNEYLEYLVINKSINLIGENKETTLINAEQYGRKAVITLTGGNTLVQGFYLTNKYPQASGIVVKSDNNQIVDCIVRDTGWDGIYIGDYGDDTMNQYNNIILNCSIINNDQYGIHIWGGYNNRIENCVIKHNEIGIEEGSRNEINGCEIFDCNYAIEINTESEQYVKNCYVHDNFMGYIITVYGGENYRIENCVFENHKSDSIRIEHVHYNVSILNCTIKNSAKNGLLIIGTLVDSTIRDCTFLDNIYEGILFYGGLRNVLVEGCHFQGNKQGIQFNYNNYFNRFFGNNFIDNEEHIAIDSGFRWMFNFFQENYWDDYDGTGWYHVYGWLNWDLHPASVPYEH